jgi:hypothetical protein
MAMKYITDMQKPKKKPKPKKIAQYILTVQHFVLQYHIVIFFLKYLQTFVFQSADIKVLQM